jgi:hypothetical protein
MQNHPVIVIIAAALIVCIAIALFIGWLWMLALRLRAILRAWETKSGYKIVYFERRNLTGRGPFGWWTNGRHQAIYHVRVRD